MKWMLRYVLLTLLIYNLVPLLNLLVPESAAYTFLTDLWIVNPIYAMAAPLIMAVRHGFRPLLPFLTAGLFIPTLLIFYNLSADIYLLIYLSLAWAGTGIGSALYKAKKVQ